MHYEKTRLYLCGKQMWWSSVHIKVDDEHTICALIWPVLSKCQRVGLHRKMKNGFRNEFRFQPFYWKLNRFVKIPLLTFMVIWHIYIHCRNIMKIGEMKHEMTLFHTMGPNTNLLFQTPSFCDLFWSTMELFGETFNIRWCWSTWKSPITAHSTLSRSEGIALQL